MYKGESGTLVIFFTQILQRKHSRPWKTTEWWVSVPNMPFFKIREPHPDTAALYTTLNNRSCGSFHTEERLVWTPAVGMSGVMVKSWWCTSSSLEPWWQKTLQILDKFEEKRQIMHQIRFLLRVHPQDRHQSVTRRAKTREDERHSEGAVIHVSAQLLLESRGSVSHKPDFSWD